MLAAPSTFVQARPNFETERVKLKGPTRGFVLHALRGDELSSQVEIVTGA